MTMDPLAEKYYSISPYAYCANNPMNYVDPMGMDIYVVTSDGRTLLMLRTEDNYDRLYSVFNEWKSPSSNDLGHSDESTIAFVHSHPNAEPNKIDEIESMGYFDSPYGFSLGGDSKMKDDAIFKNVGYYYTYFKKSGRLWRVNGSQAPKLIKTVNSDYKQLLVGKLKSK